MSCQLKVDYKDYVKKIAKLTYESQKRFNNREHGGVITMDFFHKIVAVVQEYEKQKERVKRINALQEIASMGENK